MQGVRSAVQQVAGFGANEQSVGVAVPSFVHAVVTELAGPGLRIEAPLRVRAGDRVVVVFRINEMGGAGGGREGRQGCVIENAGLVRHCHSTDNGVSIAVELSGLSEGDIDELVRMTNVMASRNSVPSTDDESSVPVTAESPAVVQEV